MLFLPLLFVYCNIIVWEFSRLLFFKGVLLFVFFASFWELSGVVRNLVEEGVIKQGGVSSCFFG